MGALAGVLGGLAGKAIGAGARKIGEKAGLVKKKDPSAPAAKKDDAQGDKSAKQGPPPYKAGKIDAPQPVMGSMKKGGRIKKTGLYHMHANEYVVPAKHTRGKRTVRKRTVTKL